MSYCCCCCLEAACASVRWQDFHLENPESIARSPEFHVDGIPEVVERVVGQRLCHWNMIRSVAAEFEPLLLILETPYHDISTNLPALGMAKVRLL